MELALAAPDSRRLDLLDTPWRESVFQGTLQPRREIESIWEDLRITRLYFGQEFCDRALPGEDEVASALSKAGEKGLKFTLVTPYLSERGLGRAEKLLAGLESLSPFSEVVCNDWGLIYLIRKKYSTLVPVMGRLLNKAFRDPRITGYLDPGEGDTAHRFSSAANPYMKNLLKVLRVARVEMDNLPQGMAGGLADRGAPASLYIPYGFVSTGRICLTGSWGLSQGKKFTASGSYCSRMCKHYFMDMKDLGGCVDREAVKGVFQKGNTVFYRQSEKLLSGGLKESEKLGVNRIVYQPDPL